MPIADTAEQMVSGTPSRFDLDPNTPPPVATNGMFYGIVGDVGRAAAKDTEVNSIAAAGSYLSYLSAQIGRDVYMPVGNTFHHARLFTCHIGRSGRGRKGDAVSMTHRIRSRIEEVHCLTHGHYHSGGLSTREGLALLVHDGYTQGKQEIPPVDDKRLWIVENEFANVLHQSKRDGNTLSAALRDAWDGMSIKPAIKSARIWATDPHISLHVAVTPGELRELMSTRELSNGFANRFLMLWAERSCVEPFPRSASTETVNELAIRTASVIDFAKGGYPSAKDSRRMQMTEAAKSVWVNAYHKLIEPESTETLTGLLERSAPYALRLAMIFALTDKALAVDVQHVNAALAWVKYSRQSVRYVFTSATELSDNAADRDNAEKIMTFLRECPNGATRTEINDGCFLRHASRDRIDRAITLLLSETPPKITVTTERRSDGKTGRGSNRYRVFSSTGCEVSEFSEVRQPARATAERANCEVSEVREKPSADDDLTSQSSLTTRKPESRTNSQTSQNSQSSHGYEEKQGADKVMSAREFLEGDRI
jgi:hypothetical protein